MNEHYKDKYLYKHQGLQFDSNEYEKTNYGYKITRMTNFIGIYKTKLYIYKDGTAKAVTKAEVNYSPNEQWTIYFDARGFEIVDPSNSTRKELAIWKRLKKDLICKK